MHYPSNPLQPGPIYFLTLRKCDMLQITVNVLTTANPTFVQITPSTYDNVYIALIYQYHYVGFDRKSVVSLCTYVNAPFLDSFEDTATEQGDEMLTDSAGRPHASRLAPENPECQEYHVAPGERQKPISIITDSHFEEMVS